MDLLRKSIMSDYVLMYRIYLWVPIVLCGYIQAIHLRQYCVSASDVHHELNDE